MGLKDLRLKLKAFRLGRFLMRGTGKKRPPLSTAALSKASWMAPVNHGFHVVADQSCSSVWDEESDCDSVVVQREQIEGIELWFFGVFDPQIGDEVIKFMQMHFFDKKFKESQVKEKGKEAMKKAHLSARTKVREANNEGKKLWKMGSASALVMDGDRLVITTMGDYRAIVCENGLAHQISCDQHLTKQRWPRRLMLGMKPRTSSELVVATKRINSETEFVVLGSNGIWEVMKNQEAVNLIRHIEDPHKAAECLAKEAFTRMSKSSISCLVIRFD